ncbi:MAG: RecX family transcriptional regulator, partial [Bacteroidales bacterium]|nr:RecX family transcriptional regulator [Bacteroidales bacterium]
MSTFGDPLYVKTLARLQYLCSKREYCSSDIFRKALTILEGDRESAEKITASLVSEKYIDDFRYSEAFARDKSALSGWGEAKIRYVLFSKSISKEAVDAAIDGLDPEKSYSKMENVIRAKYRSLKNDTNCRLKLL